MPENDVFRYYQKYYLDPVHERAALFKLLAEQINCQSVLYPGSMVHITPSFYFPHVIYIDKHKVARQFFSNLDAVKAYINRKKSYKHSAYIRFIEQDFRSKLPLIDSSFTLLLSIYTGGVAAACDRYLKPGGVLLSDNHHDDAVQAKYELGYELIAVIKKHKDSYIMCENDLQDYFVPIVKNRKNKLQVSAKEAAQVYQVNADYYLLRKPLS